MNVADRVRAMRERLGLSQAELAERGGLGRIEVNQVENGRNKAGAYRIREGLSRAFGVPIQVFSAYIEGEMEMDDVFRAAPTPGAVPILSQRPEWPQVLEDARRAAAIGDPDLGPDDWEKVAALRDGPSLPAHLTPRLILQLARILRSA